MLIERLRSAVGLSGVQLLLMIGSETAWIYAWSVAVAVWLAKLQGLVMSVAEIAGLLVAAALATRLMVRGSRPGRMAQAGLILLGAGAVGLVVLARLPRPPTWGEWASAWQELLQAGAETRVVLGAGLAGFLWWRGVGIGRTPPSIYDVEEEFRIGIVAMSSLLAMVALAGEVIPIPTDPLIVCTLATVFAGLVGMPLARIADVSSRPRHRDGAGLAPGGSWLAILLFLVGGLLLGALLVAQLFTFERITAFLAAVWQPLEVILTTAVYIIALPIGLLVELLVFLARLLIPPSPNRPRPQPSDQNWMDRLPQREEFTLSPEVLLALKVALALALAGLLVWIIWRAIARFREWGQMDGVDETRDSVWSWPGMGAIWRWILSRLRPIGARAFSALSARQPHGQPAPEDPSVRAIYRAFLALASSIGHSRSLPETPLEYQRRLLEVASVPGAEDVRSITGDYVRARYAPPEPAPPDLGPTASALDRLRALWRDRMVQRNH